MALVLLLLVVVFVVHRGAFEQPELKEAVLLAALPFLLLPSAIGGALRRAAGVALPLPLAALALSLGWTAARAAQLGWEAPALDACALAFAGLIVAVTAWGESFDRPQRLPLAILAAGLAASVLALLQCAGVDPIFGGMPDAARRALSFFGNTNATGQFVAPILVLAVALTSVPRERAPGLRTLALVSIAPLAAALILTRSRAALLAAVAGLLVAFAFDRRDVGYGGAPRSRLLPNALLAAGLCAAFAIGGIDALGMKAIDAAPQSIASPEYPTNKQRLALASSTIDMVKDAPIVGHGPGRFAHDFPIYRDPLEAKIPTLAGARSFAEDPHCEYLLILAEGGAIALLLFLAFAVPAALSTSRAVIIGAGDPRRAIAHANGAAFVALLVLALFRSILVDPPTALVFFLLAGQLLPLRDDAGAAKRVPVVNILPLALLGLLVLGVAHGFAQFALIGPARAAIARATTSGSDSRSLEEADRWLSRAESCDPGSFDVKQVRAAVQDALAKRSGIAFDERAALRRRMLAMRPWHPPTLAALAAIHLERADLDVARALLGRMIRANSGRDGRAVYDPIPAAYLLFELGQVDAAATVFSSESAAGTLAAEESSRLIRDPTTEPRLVHALLKGRVPGSPGDGDAAYAAGGRAQAAKDEDTAQLLFQRAHLSFALEHLTQRRFDDADRSARLARRRLPSAEADVVLALARIGRGDADASIQFAAALKASPNGFDEPFVAALAPLASMSELKDAVARVTR